MTPIYRIVCFLYESGVNLNCCFLICDGQEQEVKPRYSLHILYYFSLKTFKGPIPDFVGFL